MFNLDFINTVAFGGVVLFVGYGVRRLLPLLARYNVPAPVIGGLLVAAAMLTSPGRAASTLVDVRHAAAGAVDDRVLHDRRLRREPVAAAGSAGRRCCIFLLLSHGARRAAERRRRPAGACRSGMHPLFGVLNGSVTLTGGPATGLAFAPAFEQAGVPGAATVAVAAAMVGIVSGGLIGGPIGTMLIERYKLRRRAARSHHDAADRRADRRGSAARAGRPSAPPGEDKESYALLKALVVILVAMWIGSWRQRVVRPPPASRCRPTSARCWSPRSSATSTMRPG